TALPSSDSSEYGRGGFCLNFFCAVGLSPEMPENATPARCIFLNGSRNPHASIVQPGVFGLGEKKSTRFFPRDRFNETFWPSSLASVNSGALSLICIGNFHDFTEFIP